VADDAVGTAQIHVPHTGTVDVGHAAVEIQDLQAVFTAVDNAPVDVVGGPSRLVSDQAAVQLCFGLGQEGILEVGRYRTPCAMALAIASINSSSLNGLASEGSSIWLLLREPSCAEGPLSPVMNTTGT
jgi:hypothetical protein